MRRITLKSTLVAALAASALAAAPAAAVPVDRFDSPTSSLAGTTESNVAGVEQTQDLRGEHARDAARLAAEAQSDRGEQARNEFFLRRRPRQDLRGEHARDAARGPVRTEPQVYWAYDYRAPTPTPRAASASASKSDTDDVWLVLGIAVGAAAIFAGTAVVFTRRWRIRVPT